MTFKNPYTKAFAKHELRHAHDGRWVIQCRYPDGLWDSMMAAEITANYHRTRLHVSGDIDCVSFAYCSAPQGLSEAQRESYLLTWMGRNRSLDYIVEKACIGMGGHELVWRFEQDEAVKVIRELRRDCASGEMGERLGAAEVLEKFDRLLEYPPDTQEQLVDGMYKIDGDLGSILCDREHPGCVVAPRVLAAQAALARLCDLLDARTSLIDRSAPAAVGS